ncbi:DUF3418 domain-containing protein, partial [Salmonella enterica]|uniref:DUF3418 domain-containing protein n=1 Tax=Salmonella enterica TaxID=28901 RepID=UPI003981A30B
MPPPGGGGGGEENPRHPFFGENKKWRGEGEKLDQKSPRRDILVDDDPFFVFYAQLISHDFFPARHFDS